jgi:hypothetical protein
MTRLAGILAVAALCACGGTAPTSLHPSAPPSSSSGCTSSGFASLTWALPQPASNPAPTLKSVTVSGDTLVFTFFSGTPQFQITPQANAHFTQDPTGTPVNLSGTAGVKILLTGFRGFRPNYTGPKTLTSNGPLLLQAAELGDFEGFVSWGVGLSQPGCASVSSVGTTLTLKFVKTST